MSFKLDELVKSEPNGRNLDRQEILALVPTIEYKDGMTKQAFKDSADINKILRKASKAGGLAHVQKYDERVYGEFEGYDLLEAHRLIDRANEIFNDLPSETRNEFGNDALRFAGWASDPTNRANIRELIPAINEPGNYFPNPVQRGGEGAGLATAPAEAPVAAAEPDAGENPPTPAVED